jgi:quercetin dioxygenase-like cupin family protein
MAYEGQEIVNPRTGQRMRFAQLSEGELRIDTVNPPTAQREPVHVHPEQESGAQVSSGALVFEVDGNARRVEAGASITIPADAPHRFWNEGDEDAVAVQWFRPALDTAAFFETLFALAGADLLDEGGTPKLLQLAVMVPEFSSEIRPVSPPWPVLKVLTAVLGPVARRRGYQARRSLS